MSSTALFVGLAALQVLTGSLNTIFVKLADDSKSENSVGVNAWFDHPFLQVIS
jgi:hypothetical protein